MLYISREVNLGHNKTCTSKPQQWHKPATSRKRYSATKMSNIPIKKVKTERDFLDENKQKLQRNVFDPRALHHRSPMVWSAEDWSKLGAATDGNCGILTYKTSRDNINYCSSPDIGHVARQEIVKTTNLVTEPPTLPALAASVNERYPNKSVDDKCKIFLDELHISPEQSRLLSQITVGQVSNDTWKNHRIGRITSSKVGAVLQKIDDNLNLRNKTSAENLVIEIMQYKLPFKSKATQWGINKEPLARKTYEQRCKKDHSHFSVTEVGLLVSVKYPFLAASPDGLVECACHGKGCLEIKCTWTYRDKTVQEAAEARETCLTFTPDKSLKLKTSHTYFSQVQLHTEASSTNYCDFFYCTSNDYHKERILHDGKFWERSLPKLRTFFEKCIVPELITGRLQSKVEAHGFIKDLINAILADIFKT